MTIYHMGLATIAYTIVSAVALTFILTTAFSFLGIGFEVYGNYLLWFIALALFFAVLPSRGGTLFN
jgi:hypothetical protein